MSMLLSAIAAVDLDYTLGAGGQLPWRLPSDMRFFRRMTLHKPVIMGRRTWDSLGGPLKDRVNIVVTRAPERVQGAAATASLDEAIALCAASQAEEIMIIGGGALYAEALERVDRLYLTVILHRFGGDTHLQALNPAGWRLLDSQRVEPDDKNAWAHVFCTLERVAGEPAFGGPPSAGWLVGES